MGGIVLFAVIPELGNRLGCAAMSDPNANAPAPTDPNVPTQLPAEEPNLRDEVRQQLVTWGEELKQQLTAALDQKLDELGARLQSFGN
jgi:hypothetical protein